MARLDKQIVSQGSQTNCLIGQTNGPDLIILSINPDDPDISTECLDIQEGNHKTSVES